MLLIRRPAYVRHLEDGDGADMLQRVEDSLVSLPYSLCSNWFSVQMYKLSAKP